MRIGEHKEELRTRVRVLSGVVGVLLAAVAGAFWFVQVVKGSYYRDLGENNRLRRLAVKAPRGLILDRNGRVLVENLPSYNLMLDRSRSADLAASLQFAAPILARPLPELEALLERYRGLPAFQPVLLGEGLPIDQVARFRVEELEHPEFVVEVGHRRLYRMGSQGAHVLGYLGEASVEELENAALHLKSGDWVGRRGVEKRYDEALRGDDGEQVVVVDSRGQPVEELGRQVGRPGGKLTLTLDSELQQEAETLLAGQVGAIVALDPRDGEILALVSSPAYDPNLFTRRLAADDWNRLIDDPFKPLQNRALQSAYPPGSVFKVVVAAAGLAEHAIDLDDGVFCNGAKSFYKRPFHCWKAGGHGWVTLETALKYSCDIYFYELGQKLGIERIARYARMFDLGQPTGIDLDGERRGLVPDPVWSEAARKRPWYAGETISVAIGQGALLATPLQMATVIAAFANGGKLVTPHLVRDPAHPAPAPRPLDLPPAVLDPIRRGMWRVVNDQGTGASARVAGVEIAGKTGTSQVVAHAAHEDSSTRPWEERNHAWFASFAPYSNPEIVIVVFVEHGGQGSRAAAPIAKALYEKQFGTAQRPAPAS
jgi:penicillin-binding protein 2